MQSGNKEIIRNYIMKQANLSKLGDMENIIEKNYLDSMGIIEFSTWLEKQFAIQITDEDFSEEYFFNVISITDFVEKKTRIIR